MQSLKKIHAWAQMQVPLYNKIPVCPKIIISYSQETISIH